MSRYELLECERLARHLLTTYDDSFGKLEEYYAKGMYTELVYITVHGFMTLFNQ